MKHHPYFRSLLSSPSSSRLSYAARVLNEGGLQSVPTKLHFPGGAIIGCSAGFVNVGKIKGTHNAMKSGMLAAEAVWENIHPSSTPSSTADPAAAPDLSAYTTSLFHSWIHSDLYEIRNLRPSFNTPLGIWGGIIYSGIDSFFLKGRVPWTFKHQKKSDVSISILSLSPLNDVFVSPQHPQSPSISHDASATHPSSSHDPINYPPYEPPLSTDLLTSVSLTGTNHGEDQPVHLRVVNMEKYLKEVMQGKEGNVAIGVGVEAVGNVAEAGEGGKDSGLVEGEVQEEIKRRQNHVRINVNEYAGLLGRACPAGVYEYVVDESESGGGGGGGEKVRGEGWAGQKLVINSQVCFGGGFVVFFFLPDFVLYSFTPVRLPRIAFTANYVISKYQLKILHGRFRKEVVDPSTVSDKFLGIIIVLLIFIFRN
jgi:electron-transferring-flavoprotein dehydrogenase